MSCFAVAEAVATWGQPELGGGVRGSWAHRRVVHAWEAGHPEGRDPCNDNRGVFPSIDESSVKQKTHPY